MTAWQEKAERGSAGLIKLIAWLARVGGRRLCRLLLYPIVAYFLLTDRGARRASREYWARVSGGVPVQSVGIGQVFRHLYAFAATLLDRVYMAAGEFDRFAITIEGVPLVTQALAQGRGCVLLGSHLGSFDLLMLAHRALDRRKVSYVMRVDPRARVRNIAGVRDADLDFIAAGQPETYLRAFEALQAGSMVALLADRTDGGAGLGVPFLDAVVQLPLAPHVLAARAQAPVLMCFGLYEGDNRYRIEFVECGPTAAATARGQQLAGQVENYALVLARYAQRYPLNWFNFYPYWQS